MRERFALHATRRNKSAIVGRKPATRDHASRDHSGRDHSGRDRAGRDRASRDHASKVTTTSEVAVAKDPMPV
jgi:hypothetical protein